MGLTVEIPKDEKKRKQQIEALKWAIANDTREIDRQYHQMALDALEKSQSTEERMA